MTDSDISAWKTKVAARLHDPAEKALVLLRDPAGHENGTSRALSRLLGIEKPTSGMVVPDSAQALAATALSKGISEESYRHIQRADWWAAAADRPQWPMEEFLFPDSRGQSRRLRIAPWAQVRWTNKPVLIHPLSGEEYDLGRHGSLSDSDFKDIRDRSLRHHKALLQAVQPSANGEPDWKKILLALWRFAPELIEEDDFGRLGALWKLLPADTRVPDHSIWDHLDLTSAFAGAFCADPDGEPALLTVSIGPVQSFISSARKMEDLWAGSHLLSRLSWEAMQVVCDQSGPDAILFPRLRGVPQVDLWLRDHCELPAELFNQCKWQHQSTDSNPLFAAALPNRFVAVVPHSHARAIANRIREHLHVWIQNIGTETLELLLKEADIPNDESLYCHQQMRDQLADFPEMHWAIVPFSLIGINNPEKQTGLDTSELCRAMQPFFGTEDGEDAGFLASPAWQLLKSNLTLSGPNGNSSTFFAPNPGVLYPAVHELAERALAAAKSVRPFRQQPQQGWRCTLSGETEWLTTNRKLLSVPAGRRRLTSDPQFNAHQHHETLWLRLAQRRPAWASAGEHLGALAAIKRLWPTIFAREASKATGLDIGRFVISTHTMSLVHQLGKWMGGGAPVHEDLNKLLDTHQAKLQPVALPRQLARNHSADTLKKARLIPSLLDLASDGELDDVDIDSLRRLLTKNLIPDQPKADARLETYYSLVMLDGDRMGAWLSGGEAEADPTSGISYLKSFHPQVQAGFEKHASSQTAIARYGAQKRAISPNRHLAISGALNDFSLTVVRHVLEYEYAGRLIYAGGDDVLAMLPVADVLPGMQRLRYAYSGHDPRNEAGANSGGLVLNRGFALLKGELMRMMGTSATASAAAVIAHHQAPLATVRRELEAAGQRAKEQGGRDAFSITIIKRAGGALYLTDKWGEAFVLLEDLRDFLCSDNVSRRAAYRILQWLSEHLLPNQEGSEALLRSMLGYQLQQQSRNDPRCGRLAMRLTALAQKKPSADRISWLRNFISVAEFMARELRAPLSGDAS